MFFREAIQSASARHGVNPALLLAIAKQESRFSPGVRSIAGAVGVMQLMPSTASSIAGEPLAEKELMQPSTNIILGAAYISSLLELWGGDAFLSVASYNAGPGTVSSWPPPSDAPSIELWVEQIPYAETRFYTKKVLDNVLSYLGGNWPGCDERFHQMGQTIAETNASHKNKPQQKK